MKITQQIYFFSMLLKLSVTVLSSYLASVFLHSLIGTLMELPKEWEIAIILIPILALQGLVHYSIKAMLADKNAVNITTAIISVCSIALIDFYAVEELPFFKKDISTDLNLVNVDSLSEAKRLSIANLEKRFEIQEDGIKSQYDSLLSKNSKYSYLVGIYAKQQADAISQIRDEKASESNRLLAYYNAEIEKAATLNNSKLAEAKRVQTTNYIQTTSSFIAIFGFGVFCSILIGLKTPKEKVIEEAQKIEENQKDDFVIKLPEPVRKQSPESEKIQLVIHNVIQNENKIIQNNIRLSYELLLDLFKTEKSQINHILKNENAIRLIIDNFKSDNPLSQTELAKNFKEMHQRIKNGVAKEGDIKYSQDTFWKSWKWLLPIIARYEGESLQKKGIYIR